MTPTTGSPDLESERSIERIALVRRAPTVTDRSRLRQLIADPECRSMAFFQGEGVAWLEGGDALDLFGDTNQGWACVGSWRRRHSDDPLGACRLASLAEWLDLLLPRSGAGPELVCLGHGDRVPDVSKPAGDESASGTDLLFEIRHAPADDRDRLETLEPVLAAAALELDVDVLFEGAGTGHLAGPGSEGWKQLTDFDLGRMWILQDERRCVPAVVGESGQMAAPSDSPMADSGSKPIDVEHLRRRARKIVGL